MTHCQTIKRSVHLFNLDPAAETFTYQPSIAVLNMHADIRDLITLSDVMEELDYGPNGLSKHYRYLVNNFQWLEEQLENYEEDYLIIDCPGQIELYTHFPIMKRIVELFERCNYRVCGVYVLDCQFVEDVPKFFSGVLSATAAMVQLEIPHINVMSKMDLLGNKEKSMDLERFFDPDPTLLSDDANRSMHPKFHALNKAIVNLIDEFNMVSFIPLNNKDEDSVTLVLAQIDNAVQYGEDLEPTEPKDMFDEGEEEEW
ncbi:ATP binding protein [Phlyctochytrium planicorne]|nr:ATP binding protein [Phlyctochytrium planicorne]